MEKFITFYQLNNKGKLVEALGTDSNFPLDSKLNLVNMIKAGYEQMSNLKFIHPSYVGFKIMCETRSNPMAISSLILVKRRQQAREKLIY